MTLPVSHIIVGVADMAPVRSLWCDRFGLEVVAEQPGSDAALEALWGLKPGSIVAQLLVRTPARDSGWLHFVQFSNPEPPVREGAAATDWCPKNIDVNCVDIDSRVAELVSDGHHFRSAVADSEVDGLSIREVHMPAHDGINVVLIEIPDWSDQLAPHHYGAVTSFVTVVPDAQAEQAFYVDILGLASLIQHRLEGAAIEQMIGLPPGAALELQVLGDAENIFGRIELISYVGQPGADLYRRARPPATGSLGARFRVDDLAAFLDRAAIANMAVRDAGVVELIFGRCHLLTLRSPAGFCIEVFAPC